MVIKGKDLSERERFVDRSFSTKVSGHFGTYLTTLTYGKSFVLAADYFSYKLLKSFGPKGGGQMSLQLSLVSI